MIVLAAQALDGLGLRDYRITVGHVGVLNQLLRLNAERSRLYQEADQTRARIQGALRKE